MIPEQSYLGWKVAMTVLPLTAVGSTAFRLYYRRKTRRLWWDDYTAIVPLVAEFIYIPVLWKRIVHSVPGSDTKRKVILYYSWVCAFMTILWWSRLSLGFSIARIFPPALKPRKYAFMMIFGIFLTWIALVTAEVSLCATNTSWHNTPTELLDCRDNYLIGIALATTDIVFNILLIAFPIYRLWDIKLPQNQRRMVLAVFSASLLTLLSAIAFTTISYSTLLNRSEGGAIVNRLMGSIEAGLSIIVSNTLVIVSWIYRRIRKADEIDVSQLKSDTLPSRRTSRNPGTTYILGEMKTTQEHPDKARLSSLDLASDAESGKQKGIEELQLHDVK